VEQKKVNRNFDKKFKIFRPYYITCVENFKMPGRQSHGHAPSKKPKVRINANKSSKRAQDAFSIASHENPYKIPIKKHRLGAQEGGNRPGKRRRDEDEDEDDGEEEAQTKKSKKGPPKGRFDELDLDEGSDSEGNTWKLGQVDSDDDSDLDSDEAFGESDEERFEGFAFSGSSDKKQKKKTPRTKDINLDEDEEDTSDSELEEGDLGDGAVDLATMLDMSEEEGNEALNIKQKLRKDQDSDSMEEDADSEETDEDSSVSSADEDEDDETQDPVKLAALQNMIASLPQVDESGRPAKQRNDGASEYNTPSDFALTSTKKLTLEDMGLGAISDPNIKSSLKILSSDGSTMKKSSGKLEVPLAKRQQDRLDRSAAYDKSKETLDRWTDTVKHNRRAEHLVFPLPDNDVQSAKSNKQLVPTNLSKPFNELEATIQSILEESGLATANGKDDEDHIREFEELETKKLSIEEVKARRDQLRMARELLFREEVKAKRIKKIKSKSYRKVHRKQREKEERLNQEALAEGGFVPSEDEIEAQDRRRAEERMGSRHRGSKWAKAMKGTGRAAWDEEARSGVTEMARRDEELRKRVEGRAVRREFDAESDGSFDDSDDDISGEDDATEQKRLLRKLGQLDGEVPLVDPSLPGGRLANMDFMRKADAAKKKRNDAMVEEIRRGLAGEESESEKEDTDVGRRAFGPGNNVTARDKKTNPFKLNEFEEPVDSDDDEATEVQFHGLENNTSAPTTSRKSALVVANKKALDFVISKPQPVTQEGGAWSKVTSKSSSINEAEAKRRRHRKNDAIDIGELDLSQAAAIATQRKARKPAKKTTTLEVDSDDEETDEEIRLPFAIRDQELIKRAFAGADVVGEFEAEKKQTIEDEDEKIIDNTLPGWGSWVGDGVSKREKARHKGRFLTKSDGIKAKNRKDAKLDRVIINEKRVKKVCQTLPHL
jgi:U3 small nucleolar RNA-associated protein 14